MYKDLKWYFRKSSLIVILWPITTMPGITEWSWYSRMDGISVSLNYNNSDQYSSVNGTILAYFLKSQVKYLTLNGLILGHDLNLDVNKIEGRGMLWGSDISISCEEFDFKGTISCSGECKIYAKKDFDLTMFNKEGGGKFIIIIRPSESEIKTIEL